MEIHSAVGRNDGIGELDLAALSDYNANPVFSEAEQAALAYAESMVVRTAVPDELFVRVRASFSEDEIVELTALIAWEICAAKFNRALEIETQGVCVVQPGAGKK